MTTSATVIPKNFGTGGLTPSGGPNSKLRQLLSELQSAANGADLHFRNSPDAAANTTTSEAIVYRVKSAGTLSAIRATSSAAVAADPTNNATITFNRRNADGSNPVTIATFATTGSNSLAAFVALSVGAITNGALTVGQLITMTIAKGGTGVQLPSILFDGDIAAIGT